MCEINSHGGIIVEKKILEECLKNGAILAEPGEFTKRAFLNGRIDLTKAEAIMDVISSDNDLALKASIKQLKGKYMEELEIIFDDWKAINKNSLNEIKKLKNILELVGNSYIGLVEESRDKL